MIAATVAAADVLRNRAIELLTARDTLGIVLSLAADELTSGAHAAWETDTLLLFLEEEGALPDEEPRDRLLAVTAVRANPAHLWDARVFENLTETLNGRIAVPESVNGIEIGEACWTVAESQLIAKHYEDWKGDQPYGDETAAYVAALCASNGLVLLPPELSFAQDALDTLVPKVGREEKLKEDVLARLRSATPPPYDEDDAVCVQARILQEAGLYVSTLRTLLTEQLALGGVRL